ncbi:unnamed protein product [Phyllotreta striolata]|uniref:F-box domain-containing protein n=1 Tax=Phyllotreta striolata TaxID=444603 RepID=A0A9N9XIT6_PHYSR|nr:unnamed protein product [Phyllotreta striolata]
MSLDSLCTELIVKICSYLNINDLCSLKQTSKRYYDVISSWAEVLCKKDPLTVVTNQNNDKFVSNCYRKLHQWDKYRVSRNWVKGKYTVKCFPISKKRLLPDLKMTDKYLWISRGEHIFCYKRNTEGVDIRNPEAVLLGKRGNDVINFQIKNDMLVSAYGNGSIALCDNPTEGTTLNCELCHDSDINSIDVNEAGTMVVSGCREGKLKIWSIVKENELMLDLNNLANVQELTRKVSISDFNNNEIAVSTRLALSLYDLNKLRSPLTLTDLNKNIVGVNDIKWDGLYTFWTCGHDSLVRHWDLRLGRCVKRFLDPCDAALYCLELDQCNTILAGAQSHGRVTLWDSRLREALQIYFTTSNQTVHKSSPVYSLAFDADYLYTATDCNLNFLNFAGYTDNILDHRFFLQRSYKVSLER